MQLRPEMCCHARRAAVINQILNGYREGRVTRGQLETAVHHLLQVIESLKGRNGENGKENI